MKLSPQRVGAFLRDPGACRVVLLHGDDVGMMRDRASALVRAVAGSVDDPFRVAELNRDEVGRLADEAASQSLTGGRRVVRLRDAGDSATAAVTAILKGAAPALVVLEATSPLPPRSRLRALAETAPDAAAIACYPEEGRALEDTIRSVLTEAGVAVDREAVAWLSAQLGADRARPVRNWKLALYVGPAGVLTSMRRRLAWGPSRAVDGRCAVRRDRGEVSMADRALELAVARGWRRSACCGRR